MRRVVRCARTSTICTRPRSLTPSANRPPAADRVQPRRKPPRRTAGPARANVTGSTALNSECAAPRPNTSCTTATGGPGHRRGRCGERNRKPGERDRSHAPTTGPDPPEVPASAPLSRILLSMVALHRLRGRASKRTCVHTPYAGRPGLAIHMARRAWRRQGCLARLTYCSYRQPRNKSSRVRTPYLPRQEPCEAAGRMASPGANDPVDRGRRAGG